MNKSQSTPSLLPMPVTLVPREQAQLLWDAFDRICKAVAIWRQGFEDKFLQGISSVKCSKPELLELWQFS